MMRSILVHLRDAAEAEVAAFLSRHYPPLPGSPWTVLKDGKPALSIDFHHDLQTDFSEEAWRALTALLGREPGVTVVADVVAGVSGRRSGEDRLREFAGTLLGAFQGIAQDEHNGHWWTRQEIEAGKLAEGHPLFDDKGGHEDDQRQG